MMAKLRYEPIPKMSKRDISQAVRSGEDRQISRAVLSAALYSGDGQWAEKLLYKFIDHPSPIVRGTAFLSLGHIARVYGTLDRNRAVDVLRVAKNDRDKSVRGLVNDAL